MNSEHKVLRTPDECFAGLPDFAFAPHYSVLQDTDLGPLRMHRLDEGPKDAPVVLMLHGEPTWSFLYRKVIPPVVRAGYRAVAPDFIGFGRSDKLTARSAYTVECFVRWLRQFVEALDLKRITLICQDWGGPIGLRVLSEIPDRFDAVLATNTVLPNFEPPPRGIAGWPGEYIEAWAKFCRESDDLPVSEIIRRTVKTPFSTEVAHGYDAPFPDPAYKVGALAITGLIPIRPDMAGLTENRRAWTVLESFNKPFLNAFSDGDPITIDWAKAFADRVPGARNQPHTIIANSGHFVQEEQPEALSKALLDLLNRVYG